MKDTRKNRIRFIHETKISNYTGKAPTLKSLNEKSDNYINAVINADRASYENWLSTEVYLVIGEQNGTSYMWDNWRADDDKGLKASAQASEVKLIDFATAKDHHFCKYCDGIADGKNKDVLCTNCREIFGHSLYSEL